MPALAMDHFTILTDRLDETVAFYDELLGLQAGERPPFKFPGAWLYCGGRAVLHIVAGRPLPANPAGIRSGSGGAKAWVLRKFAFGNEILPPIVTQSELVVGDAVHGNFTAARRDT